MFIYPYVELTVIDTNDTIIKYIYIILYNIQILTNLNIFNINC